MTYRKNNKTVDGLIRNYYYPRVKLHKSDFNKSLSFSQINTSSLGTNAVGLTVWDNKLYVANRNTVWEYQGGNLFFNTNSPNGNGIDISNNIYSIYTAPDGIDGLTDYKLTIGCYSDVTFNNAVLSYWGLNDGWCDASGGGALTDRATIISLYAYEGHLYCGTKEATSGIGEVYRMDVTENVYTKVGVLTGSTQVDRLIVHSNNLYALISDGSNSYCYYRNADNDWPDTLLTQSNTLAIFDTISYRDTIYTSLFSAITTPIDLTYYYTDWNSFALNPGDMITENGSNPVSFVVFEDKLFIASSFSDGAIKIYSEVETKGNYKLEYKDAQMYVFTSMIVYNENIYGLSYDGSLYKSIFS